MFSTIKKDIQAALSRDPAAGSAWEVILVYPGFHALVLHRVAHALMRRKFRLAARIVAAVSRSLTGIEIHPSAVIGEGLFIDHGMGVVIGETVEIGRDVTIYQGVTLGGTGKDTGKRHPTIGSNVVISSGAKVLGPFTVGDYSKIGAGSVVLQEVPPHSTVVGIPGKIVRRRGDHLREAGKSVDLDQVKLPDPLQEQLKRMARQIEHLEQQLLRLEAESRLEKVR
ncbi:CysE2 [Paenibacillus mucilaginosus 3016]|uniref:Serine acetyltransferase n=2 Tax=Paenibacillus mucilaginosus TaxID=61624 RepID=H6NAX6_9BACL|nr:serine O-acetyltransferase [Paenibacillus mucilaginosus]AFC31231.1 CysE2 [Paenibacillus mucilaginosus 3016]AFH63550.2 serine acetyltransferase [Paenibacillus mucilaginosus K02]WFA19796.1 serine O-acetyltransferase [Paenibacillus mucilaginosus]